MAQTLGGLFCSGLVYVLLSLLIRWRGMGIILRLLPPIVTGPVIVVIGLVLAPVAVNMALGKSGDGAQQLVPENTAMIISMASLAATVLVSLLGRGFLRLVPILCGIAVGFAASLALGVGGWEKVLAAPWLAVPAFTFPEFSLEPILFIIPITLAPAIEHFGDVIAISSVTGKDYLKDPGIKNTMLGDGIATMAACAVGGPPNTTYSEVTGAVTLTRAFGRALTDAAGIPPELVSSLPLLSMTGQEELFIENFKGILQYTDAVLLLQTKACLLRIEGQHLFLVYYTKDALKLTGTITSICFLTS